MPIDFFTDDKFNANQKLEFEESSLEKYKAGLVLILMSELKKEVIQNVIPSLGPLNFRGEAITYMQQRQIPLNEVDIKKFSEKMLAVFVKNVDDMIIYDEKTNSLLLSPFIEACEYGDFYRPILRTITRSIETAFAEL